MAVVPMQKIQAVVHQHDVDEFLTCLQRFGAMEFTEVNVDSLTALSAQAPHAVLLPRVQHVIGFLTPYQAKKGLLQTLKEGSTVDFSEADVSQRLSDTDATLAVVRDIEQLQVEFAEKTAAVAALESERATLALWKPVSNKLSELDTASTTTLLVTPGEVPVASQVTDVLEKTETTYATEVLENGAVLVTVVAKDVSVAIDALAEADLVVADRPNGVEAPAVELVAVEEKLAAVQGELGVLHDQAEHAAHTHLQDLRVIGEMLEWEQDRFATLNAGKGTASTAVFNGWLREDARSQVESELEKNNIAVVLSELELAEGEEPPVEIKNSRFIQPFEAVTRLYGMPGHTDLDPTLFLAGFFFLFFGLSLTDVGYGATLAVISGGLLLFAKLGKGIRSMLTLLFYIGIATVLVGALFGGYFGIAPELLPAPLQALQQFDPIGNPLPVFYLALSLGVFQVMVGLVLRIYSDSRNGKLVDGLWEQGPWLMLFSVGIVYVLSMAGYASVPTDIIVKLSYFGLGLLVIGAIRQSKGILEAVMNVFGSLYGSVGFLSDILSYSRLLALGLATTALAFAVNLIAGIVYGDGGFVGAILAGIILVIGHVFTLAVNTLGAFIHSARLQFVEFFGKFVVGTGRSFSPLSRSEKHVTIAKE